MKKLIILFSMIISSMLFMIYYDMYNYQTFFKIYCLESYIERDSNHLHSVCISDSSDKQKTLSIILDVAKKQGITICHCAANESNGISYSENYIYSPNNINQYLRLEDDNRLIDFSKDDTKHYYSSLKQDQKKYNLLTSFNHDYFITSRDQITIYPFIQALYRETLSVDNMALYIYTDHYQSFEKQVLNEFKKNNIQLTWSNYTEGLYEGNDQMLFDEQNQGIIFGFIVCIICYLIALSTLVIQNKKNILIHRMNGYSHIRIFIKLFSKTLLLNALCFLTVSLILTVLLTNQDVLFKDFHLCILKYNLYYFISLIVISILILLYMKIVCDHVTYQDNLNKQINYINWGVKVCVSLLLVSSFSLAIHESIPLIINYFSVAEYEDTLQNLKSLTGVPECTTEYLDQLVQEGYFCDFSTYYAYHTLLVSGVYNEDGSLNENVYMKYPYINVNTNYLKLMDNHIKGSQHQKINVDQLESDTYLVPEKYENDNLLPYIENLDSANIIYVDHTGHYLNLNLSDCISVNDPIIKITNHWTYDISIFDFFLPLDKDISELQNKYQIPLSTVSFGRSHYYKQYMQKLNQSIKRLLATLLLYTFVLGLFIYQSVYIYLNNRKKELAIEYLNGYTKWQRYSELIIVNSCLYLVIFLASIMIMKNSIQDTFNFVCTFGLIEMVIQYILLSKLEKKNIVAGLKGE